MLFRLTVLTAVSLIPAFADFKLTQAFKMEMNRNLPMPAQAAEGMKALFEPKVTVMELQGQNMRSRLGRFEILYLLDSGMMHVIDVEKRQYATVPMSRWDVLAAGMQNASKNPEAAEALAKMGNMDWMKMKLEPAGKGDAGDVAGLGAEVDLYNMRFEITGTPPNPMVAKALGAQSMKIAYWTAPMPPSFLEMGEAQHKFMQMFGAAASMTKQSGKGHGSPMGLGEPFLKLQDEYTKKGRFMVKMVMEMYMDFAAMGAPVPPEMERLGSEPLMTMTIETRAFSDEPLDPKLFIVPVDFESRNIEELDLSGLLQGASAPKK